MTDKKGISLSVVIMAANTHNMNKAATETLDGIIVVKRRSLTKRKQNLCLDKGYDFPEVYNMRLLIEDIYHPIYVILEKRRGKGSVIGQEDG